MKLKAGYVINVENVLTNGIGNIVGNTSLVHARGVNKDTKRTQTRMSRILNGSCALSKSIESMCRSLALGIYIASISQINARQTLRVEHNRTLDISIIDLCKRKCGDEVLLRMYRRYDYAMRHLSRRHLGTDRRFRFSFVTRYRTRSCTFILSHPGCTRR